MGKKETGEHLDENQKRKRPWRRRLLLPLLLLIAAVVCVIVFQDTLRARFAPQAASDAAAQDEAFTYETGSGQVFAPAGNGLAVASSSALELLDARGDTLFKQVVSYDTPAVFASDTLTLFCDLGSERCVLVGADGAALELSPAGSIRTASMNENGAFALVTDAAGYKGLVSVYNSDGALSYQWWSGTGYVLCAAVSPDGRTMAALCAETGGTVLHLFRLSSDTELARTEFSGELLFDLRFLGNNTLCAVGDEALVFLSADGTETGRYEFGGSYLMDYAFGGESFVAVYLSPYRTGGGGTLSTVASDGTLSASLPMEQDVVSLSASSRLLAVMTAAGLHVYGQELATPRYETSTLMTAKEIILRPNGDLLLLSAYSAELIEF
ncbi:MAG: DUF5711 family protein [Oscillospiraceae bacterium]|nr:DUF5711 family protein [Oscillospiraceae bacterium]